MILSPGHPQTYVGDWEPSMTVYVPSAYFEGTHHRLFADVAYSTPEHAMTHFWMKGGKRHGAARPELRTMSVTSFLQRMDAERDANPFAEINKRKFLAMWREHFS